jgi:selenocysteine-specific translation elongation factor
MHDVIVAVPNDPALASFIGKKGAINSITFYYRKSDVIITALAPTDVEDKFYAMAQSMLMADIIVISTRNIDSSFGEALVAAALLNKKTLFTNDNDILQYIARSGLNGYDIVDRSVLLDNIERFAKAMTRSIEVNARVDIDKAFPVKGIGTVLLGVVTKGAIKKHDKLYHNSGKLVEIRSIQSHDEDIEEAYSGTRVGLAVKGIEDKEVEKGAVLSTVRIPPANTVAVDMEFSNMVKKPDSQFDALFVSGFSSSNAKVTQTENRFMITFEKALVIEKGDIFLLVGKTKPRVFARGKVTSVQQ